MACQHINSINNMKLLSNSSVIFDRGYRSYEMFNFLVKNGLFFIIRLSSSYKEIQAIDSLNYNFGTISKKK